MTSTMFVRNNQPGPTVLDEEGFEFLQWEGLGNPMGADVLPVPSTLVDNHNFQRARMLGIFEVIEAEEEIQALLDKTKAAWQRQQAGRVGVSLASLGQLPAEEGSVPQEFEQPKPKVGPGELPKTVEVEVGVNTGDETATPRMKTMRVSLVRNGL
jgi:hypothetical protein